MANATLSAPAQSPEHRRGIDWLLGAAFVPVVALIVLHLFILDRPIKIDEAGFINPIHEVYLNNRLAYPAHGVEHSQTMVIHPPIHYAMVGMLMKLGLPLYSAAVMPVLVLSVLAIFLVWHGSFPGAMKVGAVYGLLIPNFLLIDLDPLRPELQMAVAWIAGLIALERARRENWPGWLAALGAFLLAYASGLHYFALAAVSGVGVYGLAALIQLGRRKGTRPCLWLFGGAALFMLPYFSFFFIPEWPWIKQVVRGVHPYSNPVDGLKQQRWLEAYKYHGLAYQASLGYASRALDGRVSGFLEICRPIFSYGIPAILVTAPVLLLIRQSRCLLLAALPLPLTLLFFAHHKSLPYFRAELSLYCAAAVTLILGGITYFLGKLAGKTLRPFVTPLFAALLASFAIYDSRAHSISQEGTFIDQIALGRAVGRKLVGPNAVVGGRSICLWYVGGGSHYHFVTNDLLYPKDLSHITLPDYFDRFDAVVEESAGSWVTYNKERRTLISSYEDGTLQMRGFFSGRVPGRRLDYIFTTRISQPVEGYFLQGSRFRRFVENPKGDYVFFAAVLPTTWAPNLEPGEHELMTFFTPPADSAKNPDRIMRLYLLHGRRLDQVKKETLVHGQIRDIVRGVLEDADASALIAEHASQVKPVHIAHVTPEAIARIADPLSTAEPVRLGSGHESVRLQELSGSSCRARCANAKNQCFLQTFGAMKLEPDADYVLRFNLRIRRGNFVVNVKTGDQKEWLCQMFRNHPQPTTDERIAFRTKEDGRVFIDIVANNLREMAAECEISDVCLERVRLRGR